MDANKDPKASINPAARHDGPQSAEAEARRPRTREKQVTPKQGAEMNPLDPGGIGD